MQPVDFIKVGFWVISPIIFFFFGGLTSRIVKRRKKEKEELRLLREKLEEAEKPIEIWCPMRSKEYAGYAARIMITKDGMEIPPTESDKRILIPIADLPYVTPLIAPSWTPMPITNPAWSQYEGLLLLEALYRCPKKKASGY